jgi:hypothetical protein
MRGALPVRVAACQSKVHVDFRSPRHLRREISVKRMSYEDNRTKQSQDDRYRFNHLKRTLLHHYVRSVGEPGFGTAPCRPA